MTFCRRHDYRLGRQLVCLALCIGFLLSILISSPARAAGAQEVVESATIVERLHMSLLEVMKTATSLGISERFKRLKPAVSDAYSMAKMLQLTVGRDWSKSTPKQRALLLDAFTDLSVATYAVQFKGFSGERFETVSTRPDTRGTILVATQIIRPEDSPVGLTYVTLKVDGKWKIIDVLLNNSISQIAVRRSEYKRTIQQDGIDGLIGALRKKADDLIPH